MRRARFEVLLSAISVALCVSLVSAFRNNSTKEAMRTAELEGGDLFIQPAPMLRSQKQSFQPSAFYKVNCAECHGSAAQKKFNPDLPESQMIDSILNGVQMETPPDMPAFANKGINEERAKALITYMKSIRE